MKSYWNKPVRKSALGTSLLRDSVFSLKNDRYQDFESAPERDFLQLLEFNINVWHYYEQLVTIEYPPDGIARKYTPNLLIYYWDNIKPANKFKPTSCEIKYKEDIKKNCSFIYS